MAHSRSHAFVTGCTWRKHRGMDGMKVWHHKTMHKKFKYGIPAILLIQIALMTYLHVNLWKQIVWRKLWQWLLIQQTSVHIFKRSCLNQMEYIILSGKAQPKMQFWCGQWESYGIGALFRLGVCSLISASMFNGLTKRLVKIAKNRTEKQTKVRFLFQILLFLHHDNGFRTYR